VRRPARRTRRRLDLIGGIVRPLVGLALAATAVVAVALRPTPLDPETNCPLAGPRAHTAILVDATDALEPRHRRKLEAAVSSERARLAIGDQLTIAMLSDRDPREPAILFSRCNPGDGADANPLFQNGARRDARWRETFGDPLDAAAGRAAKGRRGDASPLTDAIASIASEPSFVAAKTRRLVIVSDMMKHRPGVFSLYAAGATYDSFKRTEAARPPPDLQGVAIRLVQLDRPDRDARQTETRSTFWAPYFTQAQAPEPQWDP